MCQVWSAWTDKKQVHFGTPNSLRKSLKSQIRALEIHCTINLRAVNLTMSIASVETQWNAKQLDRKDNYNKKQLEWHQTQKNLSMRQAQ
jgi:hypothetical protein